jgi:diguanylate cyclase (GGDEF)-like protein/PAS domain S-box-containing protein
MPGPLDATRKQSELISASTTTDNPSTNMNSTIFAVSFVFLAMVLLGFGWKQWNTVQQQFERDLQGTVDSFIAQASITAKAALHTNRLFSQSYAQQLIANSRGELNEAQQAQLRQTMNETFFHLNAYMIANNEGELIYSWGPLLAPEEKELVTQGLASLTPTGGFFAFHYGEDGGYYSANWFSAGDQNYALIVRRPYNKFSEVVRDGTFAGFDLALYDKHLSKILITKGHYYQFEEAPPIASAQHRLKYKRAIPASNWELVALAQPGYLNQQLQKIFIPIAVILAVFIVIAVMVGYALRYLQRQQAIRIAQQRQVEQRAEKSLASIDEAVFSTDAQQQVTYVNPKAAFLFSRLGHHQVLGARLSLLWPAEDALWTQDLSLKELELLQEEQRELQLQIQNDHYILEQSYHVLYDEGELSGIVWVLRDVTDAVQNRRALEESRARYKAIFEEAAIPHCVMTWSGQDLTSTSRLRISTTNDAAVQLFHAQNQQHLIHAFAQLFSGQLDIILSRLQQAFDEHRSVLELEIKLKDFIGNDLILWTNISFKAGAANQALITFLDVTERKQASAELESREKFWSKIMDDIPDIVYVFGLDARLHQTIEYSNRSLSGILGLPQPEHKELRRWDIEIHEEDKPALRKSLKQIRTLKAGETIVQQGRVKRADGYWRVIRFTNTPFSYDADGYVCRYISTARDVTEEVEAQEALIDKERRYRLLAENVTDVIWAINTELKFTFISSSIKHLMGYSSNEVYRSDLREIFSKSDHKKLINRLRLALKRSDQITNEEKENSVFKVDMQAACKNGSYITVELQANYLWDDDHNLAGLFGVLRDVTEARKLERELILAGQVFDNSNEAILVTDNRGKVINANQAFFDASLFTLEEIQGARPDDVINPKFHGPEFYQQVGLAIESDGYWQGEVDYLRKSGEERVSWTGVSATKSKAGFVQNLIIIVSDITERKVIEQRIHKLAYYDPLTGLPNRSQMHERLEKMLQEAQQNKSNVALLFLDLDRFKPINDSMGHPAGDRVLKEVAGRLQNCIKKQDLVSRMSGDEFTIAIAAQKVLDDAADTAVKVGERILHALQQPFVIENRELFVTGSIGIALYPHDGQSVTELLKNADMAMYHAKDDGRNNVQFFDAQMNKKAVELLEMENDLRYAIEREEFEIYYQPQFHAEDSRLSGVEALLRWQHPEKGTISPVHFIPIIEDTGLIIPIGEWVLRKACQDFSRWKSGGLTINRVAVNVSARQFKQPNFVDVVKSTIAETGIKATELELELTESILIDDVDLTLSVLQQLRDMGVRTAIDDFGTGYSSLNYLKQFPVDILKIDQSFIRNLPGKAEDEQITRTIIAMAHNLGLGVIAEGVETFEQLEFLRKIDCEEVQGFYFSKPVPNAQLVDKYS